MAKKEKNTHGNEEHDYSEEEYESIPFFPDHLRNEAYVAAGILIVLMIIALLGQASPIGLEEPADPLNTPDHAKPEWYFLFLYQMLKYVPKTVGVITPIIGVIILIIWPFLPFIELNKKDTHRAQLYRRIGTVTFMVIVVGLTLMGAAA